MVSMQPLMSSISSNRGMAVISVGFLLRLDLAQGHRIGRGPGADQVNRLLARPIVVRTAHCLAVDSHHLARQKGRHRLGPLHEAPLELLRVQPGENVAEGVVGRDSVGQVQKGAEPLLLALAEHLHIDPGIGAANHGADGNGHDVQQLVPLAPLYPWVLQALKMIHDRRPLPIHHHSPLTSPHTYTQFTIPYSTIKPKSTERLALGLLQ